MNNNNSSQEISNINFILKGFNAILIGAFIFICAYFMKTILDQFLIEGNTLGMLSAEIIEIIFFSVAFFVFLFSSLSLYFSGRRNAKKNNYKLWNEKTKTAFWKYLIGVAIIFCVLFFMTSKGYINYITPVFLLLYGLLLLSFRNKERKDLLVLIGLCGFLALICFLIPSYWYASLSILGIAHATYGVVVKN